MIELSLAGCRALHMPEGQLHACEHISVQPFPRKDANQFMMNVAPGEVTVEGTTMLYFCRQSVSYHSYDTV